MQVPKFWSKATAQQTTPQGKDVAFSCWRPSQISQADAYASALIAAERVLKAFLCGNEVTRYPYGCASPREEVTNELSDDQGNVTAIVTRNRYGSLVLNTERVLFVDIDFPPDGFVETIKHLFARLLGRKAAPLASRHEENVKTSLQQFLSAHSQWNLRLYRTFAGLRAIATHDLFDPADELVYSLLEQLGSDPLYIRLCKTQKCFRARLTPKPWRCGHVANSIPYPLQDAQQTERYERWKAQYESRQRGYATCQFLGALGSGHVHPDVGQIIGLHDFATRCDAPLPLA